MADFPISHPVYLHNWWLMKSQGEENITIAGSVRKKEGGQSFFQSATIKKRYDCGIVEASDGCMVYISGFINRSKMRQNGFPSHFCSHFHNGFPYDWEKYVAQYFSGKLKEERRYVPLLILQKLPVPHVRYSLLMSMMNGYEVDSEFGKQLSDDLISMLTSMDGDSSVPGTATEQDQENADLAAASKINEIGKDDARCTGKEQNPEDQEKADVAVEINVNEPDACCTATENSEDNRNGNVAVASKVDELGKDDVGSAKTIFPHGDERKGKRGLSDIKDEMDRKNGKRKRSLQSQSLLRRSSRVKKPVEIYI